MMLTASGDQVAFVGFGAAVGYVYGMVGYPQKQSSLLATAMSGSRGSAMVFLIKYPHRARRSRRTTDGL